MYLSLQQISWGPPQVVFVLQCMYIMVGERESGGVYLKWKCFGTFLHIKYVIYVPKQDKETILKTEVGKAVRHY